MMKKFLSIILIICCGLTLFGCKEEKELPVPTDYGGYMFDNVEEMFDCFTFAKGENLQPNNTYSENDIKLMDTFKIIDRNKITVPQLHLGEHQLMRIEVRDTLINYLFSSEPENTHIPHDQIVISVVDDPDHLTSSFEMHEVPLNEVLQIRDREWRYNRNGMAILFRCEHADWMDEENPFDLVTFEEYTVTASGVTLVE